MYLGGHMDNILSDIQNAIAKDLESVTSDSSMREVYDEVADMYEESLWEANVKSKNPDGSARVPLHPFYRDFKSSKGRSTKPDFIYSGKAKDSFYATPNNEGVKFGFSDAKASQYMYDHEFGENGMPERRMMPTEEDTKNSTEQKENRDGVEQILLDHLSKKRVVNV
jgi:hypothetical protein